MDRWVEEITNPDLNPNPNLDVYVYILNNLADVQARRRFSVSRILGPGQFALRPS